MSPKPRSFVIRTWLEPSGTAPWRGTVTDLETRRVQGFSRFSDLVRHLELALDVSSDPTSEAQPTEDD